MRTRDMLKTMEDICILQQYLCLDSSHTVEVGNSMHTPLMVRMDGTGDILVTDLRFEGLPPKKDALSIPVWAGIIDQLKGQPVTEMAGCDTRIRNRWDGIQELTRMVLSLNYGK